MAAVSMRTEQMVFPKAVFLPRLDTHVEMTTWDLHSIFEVAVDYSIVF
jgi:hypothetical protein